MADDDESPYHAATLDVLFDVAKNRLSLQDSQADALDTKAGFVLGTATILTGVVVAFQQAAMDAIARAIGNNLLLRVAATLIVLALVGLVVSIYLDIVRGSYAAYKLHRYNTVDITEEIREEYIFKGPTETKITYLNEMIAAIAENEKTLQQKVESAETALNSLLVEARLTAFLIVAQTIIVGLVGGK